MAISGVFQRGLSPLRPVVNTGERTVNDQLDALTASGQTTGSSLTYSQPRGAVTSGPSTGKFVFLLRALPGTALGCLHSLEFRLPGKI